MNALGVAYQTVESVERPVQDAGQLGQQLVGQPDVLVPQEAPLSRSTTNQASPPN